ncbi:transcriptional regulator [Endozoicomonas sp. ONNA1]|uniref:helix-turn-helix domain-containing protein n=1 Tax=Endozoicomonas sp. ONNA1 TaxID=2828740 RepID=UPI0027D2788A|nr:helix-turn-helix domain-containing protein [Endozoicomonas sp. ONNA1]
MTRNVKKMEVKNDKSEHFSSEPRITIESIPSSPNDRREWIKYQLKIRGLSLAKLASKSGISRQCYSQAMYRSYPACEYNIALHLGVKPADLWPERYSNGLPKKG